MSLRGQDLTTGVVTRLAFKQGLSIDMAKLLLADFKRAVEFFGGG